MGLTSPRTAAHALVVVAALALGACDDGAATADPEETVAPQAAPEPANGAALVPYVSREGRYAIDVPAGWELDEGVSGVTAAPPGDEALFVMVERETVPEHENLDSYLDELLAAQLPADTVVERTAVPGGEAAVRLAYETDGGLWGRALLVEHPRGDYLLVAFLADVGDLPDPELVEAVLGSFELTDRDSPDV